MTLKYYPLLPCAAPYVPSLRLFYLLIKFACRTKDGSYRSIDHFRKEMGYITWRFNCIGGAHANPKPGFEDRNNPCYDPRVKRLFWRLARKCSNEAVSAAPLSELRVKLVLEELGRRSALEPNDKRWYLMGFFAAASFLKVSLLTSVLFSWIRPPDSVLTKPQSRINQRSNFISRGLLSSSTEAFLAENDIIWRSGHTYLGKSESMYTNLWFSGYAKRY